MTESAKTIRLGIVGCGSVTQLRHLPALRQVSGIEVVALSDVDSARLENVAGRFGMAQRYGDYRELIASGNVEAVAICTPPGFHASIALAAINAGKHVFVEKPLALSLQECDGMIERAAANATLKVLVGFNLRWHRLVREARALIRSGELGEIRMARTILTSGVRLSRDYADWRQRRESGGGAIFELGVHHFDVLRFLLGTEVSELYASSGAFDATAIVAARMNDDVQIVASFSEGTGESHELEIYGDKGWLRVSCYRADGIEQLKIGEYSGTLNARLQRWKRTFRELPVMFRQARRGGDYVASYTEQWRHFAEAIICDAPVQSTLTDGRRALEIALAAWESNSTQRAVRLTNAGETPRHKQSIQNAETCASRS
jgi:predicted dehydrogenase